MQADNSDIPAASAESRIKYKRPSLQFTVACAFGDAYNNDVHAIRQLYPFVGG
jgi:hypothetical protein